MTDEQMLWRNENVPASFRGTYDKAMGGKKVFAAIRAKCQDCMNWQNSEIKACTVVHCPLWPYRMGHKPRQEGQEHRNAPIKGHFGRKKPSGGIPVPSETPIGLEVGT